MSMKLKTTLAVIGSTLIMASPALAGDYSLKLRWDAGKSVEQNYDVAADKIETYCKIQVRRESSYTPTEKLAATSHCQDQLIVAFVKRTANADLTQYFAALSHPSTGDVASKDKS